MDTTIVLGGANFTIKLNSKKTKFIIEIRPSTLLEVDQESNLRHLAEGDTITFESKHFEIRKPPEYL